jgi:hypothetical protein
MEKGNATQRGRWVCKLLKDYNAIFISGAECFGPDSGKFTSFQGIRKTVIDYAACSRNLFSSIKTFAVADRIPEYYHAQLLVSLEVHIDAPTTMIPNPRKRRKVEVTSPDNTYLYKLLIQTLAV